MRKWRLSRNPEILDFQEQRIREKHICYKDSPDKPPPPDYKAAAQAMQTNQVTPFGNSTWTTGHDAIPGTAGTPGHWTGGTYANTGLGMSSEHGGATGGTPGLGTWVPGTPGTVGSPAVKDTNTTTLSPDLTKGLMGITGRVAENMSHGPDLSSVPQIADKAYGAMTARLDPQWGHAEDMQKTQLANQGLVPGGEAYDNAMRVFNQGKNDAYQQANLGAIQTMPQTYQLANDQYNQPLNQLNAIRSGAQIEGPQFTGPANYLGAAQATGQYNQGLYNAQVGQQNAMTSGLFGLAGAGIGGYFGGPWGAALGARAGGSV